MIAGERLRRRWVIMNKREEDLYTDIERWLRTYLKGKYFGYLVRTTHTSSRLNLEIILRNFGVDPSLAIGLSIKVDIVGIITLNGQHKLVFVEVKNKELTLKDLGQLWGYSQLMDPAESFLISSKGIGGLSKLLNVLRRTDILKYGISGSKYMQIAKWDGDRKSIDYQTLIPKM